MVVVVMAMIIVAVSSGDVLAFGRASKIVFIFFTTMMINDCVC